MVHRHVCAAVMIALGAHAVAPTAESQNFGRSKVQYDNFDFRIQPSPHFATHFYPAESLAVADAARMAERWYARHSALLNLEFTSNPLIFYADHPDFQQSNVVEGTIGVGTGGITEGLRERVIMPLTGVYAATDHVLGHELVHVFQYKLAAQSDGGLRSLGGLPLWVIEGMAEYLSIGRYDPNTAMWLRDAVLRDDLPTLEQLTNDPRYFPYRFGQAFWAYVGGRWGDAMVNTLFRAALAEGWDAALQSQLGFDGEALSSMWHAALTAQYAVASQRARPDSVGRLIIGGNGPGQQNVSPSVSPDGRFVAFFSSRNLFGIDLYVAETATGRVIRQLTDVTSDPHFDALSFINSAGAWSPDGQRLAVVVFAGGDNEINILNASTGKVDRRIRFGDVSALSDPAWSPDGTRLVFSGLRGGISDLYVHTIATNATRQLTNDRYAQLQPVWSPDGRSIAFATDAGEPTDFDRLAFAPLRLAVFDVSGGQVQLLPRAARGKAINPQFTPDGTSLLFVGDPDGISDIYSMSLRDLQITRITAVATGISGIGDMSPAISVAANTGDVVFSVFTEGGFAIRSLPSGAMQRLALTDVPLAERQPPGALPPSGVLPPATRTGATAGYVASVLESPLRGLPAVLPQATRPYRSRLALAGIGGASVGASVGGGIGTGLAGGVAFQFSDMLGNRMLNAAVQAQGTVKDIGGQVQYLNRGSRLNYGVVAQHVPLLGVAGNYSNTDFNIDGQQVPGVIVTRVLQRQYIDNAQAIVQYPLSSTRRLELTAGGQRIGFGVEVDSQFIVGNQVLAQRRQNVPTGVPALTFGTASLAYVGDFSFFGYTSPVAGGRYRFEAAPFVGSIDYTTVLADYRRYFFNNPFTLAIRGLHYGRYGGGAEDRRLQSLYVGQGPLMRGYEPRDFRRSECTSGTSDANDCPEFSRLNGSRIGVMNVELRVPLLGSEQFGLIDFPYFPLEIAPFFDAGVAWTQDQGPALRFDRTTSDRVPVFSTGVTARVNLLGYAVVEAYYAYPFQRPGRGGMFGFQLAPGW